MKKHKNKIKRISRKDFPTLQIVDEKEIAENFATKIYQKFDKIIKSIILFGSQTKQKATSGSDIDIIIIVDDASIQFDQELIAWYREELGKLISANPYKKDLHINTVKLTTWWQDLKRGDPVVINILRYGESLIDFGGFFDPLKVLLQQGKITPTPEAVYTALQRAPTHLAKSHLAEIGAMEGLYWAMVDSAHAAIMASRQSPPSPEQIPLMLKNIFVDKGVLNMKYVIWYRDLHILHRKIAHGEIHDIKGGELNDWQDKAEEFVKVMVDLVTKIVS